jgi:hypothetical protein
MTSAGAVFGMLEAYASKEIGLLVVFVARNRAVSLEERLHIEQWFEFKTYITFFGCQSMTVFLR